MTDSGTDYREHLLERLRDKEEASAYLNAVLEYADEPVLMLAIRDVVDAFGVRNVAESAGLNRESLYRMLSREGNPRLSSLFAVLKSIGLRLAVEVDQITMSVTDDEIASSFITGSIYETFRTNLIDQINDSSHQNYDDKEAEIDPLFSIAA
ncbi:MAG: addiction module antidote protein [Thermoleophilia bacterium]